MTNYTKFPSWRCHDGFTIMFDENKYSWCDDSVNQRKYLSSSLYLNDAKKVFISVLNKWMELDEFYHFLNDNIYNEMMKNVKAKPKIKEKACPKCNGDLKLKTGKFGQFYGCVNYPSCNYTVKAN